MLALTVLLPALLFGLGAVGLALREERALQPGFGQRGPGACCRRVVEATERACTSMAPLHQRIRRFLHPWFRLRPCLSEAAAFSCHSQG